MTRKYSKRAITKAVALVRDKGYSYASAGKEIDGEPSRDTVKRWCDAAGVRSGAADARTDVPHIPKIPAMAKIPEQHAAEPALAAPAEDDSLDSVLSGMREQLRWIKEQARQAALDGNHAQASKYNRDAAGIANTLARIMAGVASAAGDGGIVFSADRLKAARAQLIEMVDRLAASPEGALGVCPRCGADIRFARASAPDAEKEV